MGTLKNRVQALEDAAPTLGHELIPLHRMYGQADPPGYVPVYWTKERSRLGLDDLYAELRAQEQSHAT